MDTREKAQHIALELFISQGYEATSLREIAEALGVSKAALYYHFRSKEDIVQSIASNRIAEASELLDWVRAQSPTQDLLERTVLKWIDSTSHDKLQGLRFVNANPAVMRNLTAQPGSALRDSLGAVVELLAGQGATPERILLIRMAFLSINSALMAASGTRATDEEIIAAARKAALALIASII